MSEALEIIREQEKLPVADAPQSKLKRVVIIGCRMRRNGCGSST